MRKALRTHQVRHEDRAHLHMSRLLMNTNGETRLSGKSWDHGESSQADLVKTWLVDVNHGSEGGVGNLRLCAACQLATFDLASKRLQLRF